MHHVGISINKDNINEFKTSLFSSAKIFYRLDYIDPVLHNFPNLIMLLIYGQIKTFENFQNLSSLKCIYCYSKELKSFDGLSALYNLHELGIINAVKITNSSFASLPPFPNLVKLSIQKTRINTFVGLPYFPNLKELYFSHNELESLEGLDTNILANLIALCFFKNKIKSLYILNNIIFHKLKFLTFCYNEISSFSELSNSNKILFPELISLSCSHNKIKSLKDFPKLPSLTSLNINNNEIESFDELNTTILPNLKILDCRNNNTTIKHLSQLLLKFPNLKEFSCDDHSMDIYDNSQIKPGKEQMFYINVDY